eukprot:GILI01011673.1.p1 GENE.GILI01011673.1~~GILI01011673.1.p1  ORF type:complete len:427 (+),score=64.27 GILI01011673.1:117-1397(+)
MYNFEQRMTDEWTSKHDDSASTRSHRWGHRSDAPASSSYQQNHHKRKHTSRSNSADHRVSKKSKKASVTPESDGDEPGHYHYKAGESITPRYKVMRLMGDGTFGRVLECWDRKRERYCAVKVIRRVERYLEAAEIEADILTQVRSKDPNNESGCVQLLNWFDWGGHKCLVFEKLGMSLYDFLKKNEYQGFRARDVQAFAKQVLRAVGFLHRMQLTHTDLKPENILLMNSNYEYGTGPNSEKVYRIPVSNAVKLIDFGGATFAYDHHSSIINTRQYRAPEVILGLGWSESSDLWSVGCILMELYTGELLFATHDNFHHLALMEKTLGPIPPALVKALPLPKSSRDQGAYKYFNRENELRWPLGCDDPELIRSVRKQQTIHEIVQPQHRPFADLVVQLLTYEPSRRITAEEALQHAFFSMDLSEPTRS